MSDYTPKLKQILREAGCYFDRPGKGDYEIWFSYFYNGTHEPLLEIGTIERREVRGLGLKAWD